MAEDVAAKPKATTVDKDGMLVSPHIHHKRFAQIEKGALTKVNGILVHQTDTSTAQAVFNGYKNGGAGAHFLIDENGLIYQTASVNKFCYHVGKLIKSKCMELKGSLCKDPDLAQALTLGWTSQIKKIDEIERKKSYPDRFPINKDSIGIEIVGKHIDSKTYQKVTATQNQSLKWLLNELYKVLSVTSSDVFRHPQVSYKNPDEAGSAKWE